MIRSLLNAFRRYAVPLLGLAVAVLSTAPVQAGCGEPMLTLQHSEPDVPAEPCRGPNCSAEPSESPVPIPSTSVSTSPTEFAVAVLDTLTLFGSKAKSAIPDSIHFIDRVPTIPFHPPRIR
jgi:hypothetical protein